MKIPTLLKIANSKIEKLKEILADTIMERDQWKTRSEQLERLNKTLAKRIDQLEQKP